MKKLSCTLFAIIFYQLAFAQNWQPINKAYTYNYSYPNGVCSIHTVADSFISLDSVYYLNNSAKMVNRFLNRPDKITNHCFQYDTISQPETVKSHQFLSAINFHSHSNYELLTDDPHFSVFTSDSAAITSQKDSIVFGVPDSIRTIKLSSGTKIVLSKSFGILKFPVYLLQPDSGYYTLIGINEIKKGILSADSKETFEFNVGDKFEFLTGVGLAAGFYKDSVTQFTIDSKTVTGDTLFTYSVSGWVNDYGKTYSDTARNHSYSYSYTYRYSGTIPFNTKQYYFLDATGNEPFRVPSPRCSPDSIWSWPVEGYSDSFKTLYKSWDRSINPLFMQQKRQADTILPIANSAFDGSAYGSFSYAPGLGLIYYNYFTQGSGGSGSLTAWSSGAGLGSFGTFTSIKGINKLSNWKIYPNPAKDNLQISSPSPAPYTWQIMSIEGKSITSGKSNENLTTINISGMTAGIYIIQITSGENISYQKFSKL